MPQSYSALRKMFMTEDSDGIGKAEAILLQGGYTIERGVIMAPKRENHAEVTIGQIIDAMDYLMDEWDYDMAYEEEPNA